MNDRMKNKRVMLPAPPGTRFLLCIGISRCLRHRVFFLSSFLFATLFIPMVAIAEKPDVRLAEFQRVPVLFNGRKMPMDSFARSILLQFSGRQKVGDEAAASWLARTFFDPNPLCDDPIFLINHPDVLQSLSVEARKRRRYSMADLHPGLSKLQELAARASALDQDRRSPVEEELIRVYGNVGMFLQLQASFSCAFADPDLSVRDPALRSDMGFEDAADRSFLDIYEHAAVLQPYLNSAQEKEDESTWTVTEWEAFRLAGILYSRSHAHRNLAFTFMPVDPHGEEVWLSAWDALSLNVRDGELLTALLDLGRIAGAYVESDQASFDMAMRAYREFAERRMGSDRALKYMDLEVQLNRWNFFGRAAVFYVIGFIVSFVAFLFPRRELRAAGFGLILLALVLHVAGICIRMAVMGRPPVTNLYATFLFVGMLCVLIGLVAEWIQRSGLGLMASGFAGFSLLLFAQRFFLDGDTMHQVVAVLDSNFWLSTHVIAIMFGYAGVFFAGVFGHIYLLLLGLSPGRTASRRACYRAMMGILAFGLTFSFLGTMLGGVWADHSWGRFWGWDPKENGALLIVLWCAILFHARMGGMIRERGMAAGTVLGVIVVVTAWLGVNLLSVGLHSYGFTSGLAAGYYASIVFEILFVAVMLFLTRGSAGGGMDRSKPELPS